MKVVELKEELGKRAEALSGNKAWLRRAARRYSERVFGERRGRRRRERRVECPKFSRAAAARDFYHFAPVGPTFVVLPQIYGAPRF